MKGRRSDALGSACEAQAVAKAAEQAMRLVRRLCRALTARRADLAWKRPTRPRKHAKGESLKPPSFLHPSLSSIARRGTSTPAIISRSSHSISALHQFRLFILSYCRPLFRHPNESSCASFRLSSFTSLLPSLRKLFISVSALHAFVPCLQVFIAPVANIELGLVNLCDNCFYMHREQGGI